MVHYANLNPYPVVLPHERGGSVTFVPGEIISGSWWARFPTKLTAIDKANYKVKGNRIVSTVKMIPNLKSRVPDTSGCHVSCEVSCQEGCESKPEAIVKYDHYSKVAGKFFCKHCTHKSNKQEIMDKHIEWVHLKKATAPATPDVPPTASVVPSEAGSAPKASEAKPEVVDASKPPAAAMNSIVVRPGPSITGPADHNKEVEDIPTPAPSSVISVRPADVDVAETTDDYWLLVDGNTVCRHCADKGLKYSCTKRGISRHVNSSHRSK